MKKWFVFWYVDNEEPIKILSVIFLAIWVILIIITQSLLLGILEIILICIGLFIDFYIFSKYEKYNRRIKQLFGDFTNFKKQHFGFTYEYIIFVTLSNKGRKYYYNGSMAELVDASDLKSGGHCARVGSSPIRATKQISFLL